MRAEEEQLNSIRQIGEAQPRVPLIIDRQVWADIVAQLHALECRAQDLHSRQGREIADGVEKAVGLLAMAEDPAGSLELQARQTAEASIIPMVRVGPHGFGMAAYLGGPAA